jgi:L-asparaginase
LTQQAERMKLRIIITGGTFDKQYDEIRGVLTFKDSHLPEILKDVRCTVPVTLEINQLVDSLDMRLSNRLKILESCKKAREKHIVITHGTDTMTETTEVLGEAALDKTIVLTGAMVPYTFGNSDAVFNLGCAITAAQCCKKGVYIAMNGRIFEWNNVMKVKEQGLFKEKTG